MIHFQKQTCACCETLMGVQLLSAPTETENPVCLCNFCARLLYDQDYIGGLNVPEHMTEIGTATIYLHVHTDMFLNKWNPEKAMSLTPKQESDYD